MEIGERSELFSLYDRKIDTNSLPTVKEVLGSFEFYRREMMTELNGYSPSIAAVCKKLAEDVSKIYNDIRVPIVSIQQVTLLIKNYCDKYKSLKKIKHRVYFEEKYKTYIASLSNLFIVTKCKCSDIFSCCCNKAEKIPNFLRNFIVDQKSERNLHISDLNDQEILKTNSRKQKISNVSENPYARNNFVKKSSLQTELFQAVPEKQTRRYSHPNYNLKINVPESNTRSNISQSRNSLPTIALVSNRYNVSNGATAAIVSATLVDYGIVTKENTKNIVDVSKIKREKKKIENYIENSNERTLKRLFFDGRKDNTLKYELIGNKKFKSMIKEEHISLISEPGGNYIGHVSCERGDAETITKNILSYLKDSDISLNDLEAIGCDGTNTNTGVKKGIIRRFELELNRPLQWIICLLHINELPLRHLIIELDGKASGPEMFTGPVGSQLKICERLPIVNFKKVDVPDFNVGIDKNVLSTDQKYLLDISSAIIEGNCPIELASRNPGNLNLSRWLTTANRILRLYVSTRQPCSTLKVLVEFILKVYAPIWFRIKKNWSCTEGAKHTFELIRRSRYLPRKYRVIVDECIAHNAYFAHPENIILAMVADSTQNIRKTAFDKIRVALSNEASMETIRKFEKPHLNFDASNYYDMINWDAVEITVPPILRRFADKLNQLEADPDKYLLDIKKIPCHTQAVERCVKMVTEASKSVFGHNARDQQIKSKIQSRKLMPAFKSKKDFVTHITSI